DERRDIEIIHYTGRRRLDDLVFSVTEERPAKRPAVDEVDELLEVDQVARYRLQCFLHLGRRFIELRVMPRCAEVLQARLPGPRDEITEIQRLIVIFQVLVKEIVVRSIGQVFGFLGKHTGKWAV